MLYLLLLISFIIHVITFIIIKQLKMKQDNLETIEDNVSQQVKNMEDTLAIYLVELKEENEHFMKQIERVDLSAQATESKKQMNEDTPIESKTFDKESTQQTKEYQPISPVENVEDVVENSTTASILHLNAEGFTVEEIAKKLNKGKTEVELLLKFQQKK
ncbi:DUF6115 domain-containing protein [Gracilibacillus kekensis]|uniref:Coupling factor for flagellin transcription and translation n=1 Tax=Gracilibacillus kekensis TaxID=1027249 RepID=A0A1M7PHU9_9BACI|nr:hypothetical protein [Gracilibacillus kekensis]SHN16506.1 hypothetical protein SAMN05216179_2205 [Gracilibacillus kekensis]